MESDRLGYGCHAKRVKRNRRRIIPSALRATSAGSPAGAAFAGAAFACALAFAAGVAFPARADDAVSPQAAEDARILVENSIAAGRNALANERRFDPFAFFVASDGRVQRVTPKHDVVLPEPAEALALLQAAFRQRAEAGECRAVAVVADVVIALPGGGQSDALQVGIEHRSGYCRNFFHPYEREADGGIRFREPIVSRREGAVFPGCPPP